MRAYHYRYPVKLQPEQHRLLETMVCTSRTPTKHYLVARVLLMSDQSQGDPSHTDGQIAEALQINRRTVIRIKKTVCAREYGSRPHRQLPTRTCLRVDAWMARERRS
jgi:hypothetical protein